MAYVSRNFATSFRHFEMDQMRMGDDLVGLVLPRAPEVRHHIRGRNLRFKNKSSSTPSTDAVGIRHNNATTESYLHSISKVAEEVNDIPDELLQADKRVTRTRRGISRREQCRMNQARFRQRQRQNHQELEQRVKRLRKEVYHLKRGYEGVRPDGKSKRSPWAIVAEVFHLVEDNLSLWRKISVVDMMNDVKLQMFLQECFSPDVKMGNFSGVNALMEQLQHYTQNFGCPKLQLHRIESIAPGVMTVTGQLQATVTELSLRKVFPKLAKEARLNFYRGALRDRLLGQRLCCSYVVTFLFDEKNGRVERLEVDIGLLGPTLQLFKNLEDVAIMLTSSQN